MLSVFRYYNICPIFVFDGKPPPEKKELLLKRREDKIEAESEYNTLKSQLENNIVDDIDNFFKLNSKKKILFKKGMKHNDIKCIDNYKNHSNILNDFFIFLLLLLLFRFILPPTNLKLSNIVEASVIK